MAATIPTQPVPNQTLQVQLDNQNCTINIYQLAYGLFMDVVCSTMTNGGLYGVLCENINRIVRDLYLGFSGDFVWVDTEGSADPIYTGLGGRYQLVYLEPSDLPAGEG